MNETIQSHLATRREATAIEALSNETLLHILEQASKGYGHHMMRTVLPWVCKRWKDAVYTAKGDKNLSWALAPHSKINGLKL